MNILSQNGGSRRTSLDGLSGWEVLARAVRNAAAARRRDDVQGEGREGRSERDGNADEEAGNDDVRSEVVSLTAEEEKAKDEEQKRRLRRLKAVFSVKRAGDRKSALV